MLRLRNKITLIVMIATLVITLTGPFVFSQEKYKECQRYLSYGEYQKTLKCSEELQAEDSSWFYPLYLSAKAYRGLNRKGEAIRSLREAAELASGNNELFPVFFEFSHLYYTSWANKNEQNQAEKFCVDAKGIAESREFQKRIYSLCGKIYFRQKEYRRALRDLERAYRLDPKNAGLAEVLIKTYLQLNMTDKAISLLKKAPKNERTYGMLAEVYIKAKNWKGAVDATESCLKIDRMNKKCLILNADGHIGQKKWKEAAGKLQRYTLVYKKDWLGHYKLGDVYAFMKDHKRAVTYLIEATRYAPRSVCDPYVSLAKAYVNLYTKSGKKKIHLDNAKKAIDVAGGRCPTDGRYIATRQIIEEHFKALNPEYIEIDCEKQPDHPECKKAAGGK